MAQTNPLLELSNALAEAAAKAGRFVVAINARQRIPSSGIVWRPGVIVTAEHTLKRDDEIGVTLPDNRTVEATLAGRDPGTDVAVLRVPEDAGEARTASSASVQTGSMVLAVGRRGENGIGVSAGVVSAVSGPWRTWRGGGIDSFIRPDVSLYPGMSGGALVGIEGLVIGMNTSALTRAGAVTIPATVVDRVATELISRGHIARGFIGVGLHPVQLPGRGGGLVVLSLEEGGPAAKAGIYVGDVLVSINGKPVTDTDDVQTHLGPESIGANLAVEVVRGGNVTRIEVAPAERPKGGR
jgi:S1-C subfamily serine protease